MCSGSELPQHLFPSRILIILHLSALQGANGVIMQALGVTSREGVPGTRPFPPRRGLRPVPAAPYPAG
jgi:hypothetical protein